MPSGSTRARSAAPDRAFWCRKAWPDRFHAKLKRRMDGLRIGDPLDKCIDVGAVVDPIQLATITQTGGRKPRGRDLPRRHARPDGLLLSADPDHRPVRRLHPDAGGNLRPRSRLDDLPHPGRGGRACQQHPLRPCRDGLDRERQPRARHRAKAEGRRRLGERHQPVRRRRRLWRHPRIRLRPRRRVGGAAGLPQARRHAKAAETHRRPCPPPRDPRCPTSTAPPSSTSAASRPGPTAAILDAVWSPKGKLLGHVGARQPQGHPQRGRGGPRRQGLGQDHRPRPRADPLLHRRKPFGPRRRIRRRACAT